MIPRVLLLLTLVATAGVAQQDVNAATNTPIVAVRLVNRQPTAAGISRHYVRVDFSSPVTSPALGTVSVRSEPSDTVIPNISEISTLPGNPMILEVEFGSPQPSTLPVGDTSVKVIFGSLTLTASLGHPARTLTNVSGTGPIYDDSNIDKLKSDALQGLSESVASSKTQDEKNVFMGLNIIFPSGGNDTQGLADLSFNKTLYAGAKNVPSLFDELDVSAQLKKASTNSADAKHFTGGFRFRKTVLFASSSDLANIRAAVLGSSPELIDPAMQSIAKLKKRFFRALLVDDQMSFEGDVQGAAIGNVSNVVNDFTPQIATISRPVTQAGYWNLRLYPIGAELGYNVNDASNASLKNKSIVRIKSGAEINLFYENPDAIPNKVELTATFADRYLFHPEAAWDEMQNNAVLTAKGNTYWAQADFKVFVVKTSAGNAGLKLTFTRGSLPPVYSFTKALNFGLVFETNDADSSAQTKLK